MSGPSAVRTPATRPPEGRSESQLESPFAGGGGADFCLRGGAAAGQAGRNRETGPPGPCAGWWGQRGPTTPATAGRWAPGPGVPTRPHARLPPPARPLPRATFFRGGRGGRGGAGGGTRRDRCAPGPRRSPPPPTPVRPPRAHLASQVPAPLGPHARERLDPRHGRGGGGGRSRDRKAARARGPAQFLKR